MKLKSLEEFNKQRTKRYVKKPIASTGIACPRCGSELYDSNPSELLLSSPPKKRTKCSNPLCDYTGTRIA